MQVEWSEQRVEMHPRAQKIGVRGWKKRGRSTLTLSSDADSKTEEREGTK